MDTKAWEYFFATTLKKNGHWIAHVEFSNLTRLSHSPDSTKSVLMFNMLQSRMNLH